MLQSNRLSWDEFFIALATLYSSRGSCDRLRTACILVKNKRIVGAGYNGSVAGLESCDEAGHLMTNNHCRRTIHGERNAIHNSVSELDGATAYIVATPCLDCIKELLQNGIKRIVYVGSYSNAEDWPAGVALCDQKQVELIQWTANSYDVLLLFKRAVARLRGPGGLFQDSPLEEFDFSK